MIGYFLALLLAVALAYFSVVNSDLTLSLTLFGDWSVAELPLWAFAAGTALATAFVALVIHALHRRHERQHLQEKEGQLTETRQRVQQLETSLQEYENRIHDFALKVLAVSARQLPPAEADATVTVEEVERVYGELAERSEVAETKEEDEADTTAEIPVTAEPTAAPVAEPAKPEPATSPPEDEDFI